MRVSRGGKNGPRGSIPVGGAKFVRKNLTRIWLSSRRDGFLCVLAIMA